MLSIMLGDVHVQDIPWSNALGDASSSKALLVTPSAKAMTAATMESIVKDRFALQSSCMYHALPGLTLLIDCNVSGFCRKIAAVFPHSSDQHGRLSIGKLAAMCCTSNPSALESIEVMVLPCRCNVQCKRAHQCHQCLSEFNRHATA